MSYEYLGKNGFSQAQGRASSDFPIISTGT